MVSKVPLSSDILWVMELSEAAVPLAWHVVPKCLFPLFGAEEDNSAGCAFPQIPGQVLQPEFKFWPCYLSAV